MLSHADQQLMNVTIVLVHPKQYVSASVYRAIDGRKIDPGSGSRHSCDRCCRWPAMFGVPTMACQRLARLAVGHSSVVDRGFRYSGLGCCRRGRLWFRFCDAQMMGNSPDMLADAAKGSGGIHPSECHRRRQSSVS
jgi:hypothetical protein